MRLGSTSRVEKIEEIWQLMALRCDRTTDPRLASTTCVEEIWQLMALRCDRTTDPRLASTTCVEEQRFSGNGCVEGAEVHHNEKESIPSCAREQRTLAMGDVAGDRSE